VAHVRDYGEIVQRLRALPRHDWRVQQAGEISGYPFFRLQRRVSKDAPTVLVTAGIHGEEPGGVAGALCWLESGEWAKWNLNWFVLPCINPYGWERNHRRNAQRQDINRQFRGDTDCLEAILIKKLVTCRRFLFTLDLHEDVDAPGYYLYELRPGLPFIGERIVKAVGRMIPVNHEKVIDGNQATAIGLIRRSTNIEALTRRRRWPMAFHLLLHCTGQILGSETPVNFPLKQRATAHRVALRTALQIIVGQPR
jgi:murein peptide amidase A